MRILATSPGKYGDILWGLATVRAIAETFNCTVDFMVSGAYRGIADLVRAQDYIEAVHVNEWWEVQETAPMTPWAAPLSSSELGSYNRIYDLGYRGWPTEKTLGEEIYKNFWRWMALIPRPIVPLDLDRPWIKATPITHIDPYVFVGWNEQWIELKMGVTGALLNRQLKRDLAIIHPASSRHEEWLSSFQEDDMGPPNAKFYQANWLQAASYMQSADCYLGCLSAQWVLANAMGKRTVVMEPDSDRARNPLFWLSRDRNRMVIGGDGLSSFDARHTGDLLKEVLG